MFCQESWFLFCRGLQNAVHKRKVLINYMWSYAKVGCSNSDSYCGYRKSYPNKTLRSVDRHLYHNYKYWYDLTVSPSLMVRRLTFMYALYLPQVFQMDYWVKIRLFWENARILIDLLIVSWYFLLVCHSLNVSAKILILYGTGHYVMNNQRAVP